MKEKCLTSFVQISKHLDIASEITKIYRITINVQKSWRLPEYCSRSLYVNYTIFLDVNDDPMFF